MGPRMDRRKNLLRWATLLACAACLPSFLTLAARMHWLADLTTHFRVYYAVGLLPLVVVLALLHGYGRALFVAAVVAWNVIVVAPLYQSPQQYSSQTTIAQPDPRLRCLVTNVHTANTQYDRVIDCIRRERPDVFAALEVSDRWMSALGALSDDYPHRRAVPRSDNFGIALFSRFPFETATIEEHGEAAVPSIVARLKIDEQPFSVIAAHTLPPVGKRYWTLRNDQLRRLAKRVEAIEGPVTVLGDLNTTPWSPHLTDLLARSSLRDSRAGYGIQPTWVVRRRLIQLPLDYALVSTEIGVRDFRVLEDVGSDHRPVVVDLDVPLRQRDIRPATTP